MQATFFTRRTSFLWLIAKLIELVKRSLSLSLLHTLRQAHTCEHPPGTGLADAGAQVQTAILKHREESGEGTSGCQGPPATELGSHMCFITNPLAILQGKNYYLPWRNWDVEWFPQGHTAHSGKFRMERFSWKATLGVCECMVLFRSWE